MFGEEKAIKDNISDTSISIKDKTFFISYKKVNKLITALYLVTDLMDNEEPVRNKLRFLGNEVISDIFALRDSYVSDKHQKVLSNIGQILAFIDIAQTVGIISSMNAEILKKEFMSLRGAIVEAGATYRPFSGENTLSDFLNKAPEDVIDESYKIAPVPAGDDQMIETKRFVVKPAIIPKGHSIGHQYRTNIGIQKSDTLLHALGKISVHKKNITVPKGQKNVREVQRENKISRAGEILKILKDKKAGLTISDIKKESGIFKDISEKTIQRELVSMVDRGVLKRVGTKRWSKYFIPQ